MFTQGPSVPALAARAEVLRQAAEALRAAYTEPAKRALVAEAATNLQEAQLWFQDPRLQDSTDCRLWVDAILRVTERRLRVLQESLEPDRA
jgi:hypothetical protein